MTGLVLVVFVIWGIVALVRRDQMATLRADVAALKVRVAGLEAAATAGAPAPPASAPVAPPRPAPAPVVPPPAPASTPPVDRTWEGRPVASEPTPPPVPAARGPQWDWTMPAPAAGPTPTAQPAPRAPREKADWERWIGTHLLAIGGGAFLLLGATFFVKLAISDGWLTPARQVALALIGGCIAAVLAVRTYDARDRARSLLGQALAAVGAGSAVLGLVAGARIYDTQIVPTPVALLGTGVAAAFLVACAWRWRAQATAALGITTALLAPPLVGAGANLASAAFVAVALLAAGFVTVRRAWPWLVHVGLWLTVWQLAAWLLGHRDDFVAGTASTGLAVGVIAAITGWWLLVAGPALLTERRGGWRMPPATAVVTASSAATLIGCAVLAIDHHPESWPVRVLGLTLVAVHVLAAAALWRPARSAALLLVALGGAIAALTIAALAGDAGQAVFWSIEAVALLALARRERDWQVTAAAAGAYVLALGQALILVPPDALVFGAGSPGRTLLVGAVATAAIAAGLRAGGRARPALPWALGAVAAAAWTVQALTVSLVAVHPGDGVVEQPAQLAATGALLALALAVIALVVRWTPDAPRHALALIAAWVLGAKAVADLAIDPRSGAVALGLTLLVGGLVVLGIAGGPGRPGRRTVLDDFERPTALLPAVVVGVLALFAYLTPAALAVGSDRLASSLGLWLALTAALVASAILPGAGRRVRDLAAWRAAGGGLPFAGLLAAAMAATVVTAVTLAAPDPGTHPVDQPAQVLATVLLVAWWLAIAELARAGVLGSAFGGPIARAVPVLGWLVAVKGVGVDAIGLGLHGSSLVFSAAAFGVAAVVAIARPATGSAWPAGLPALAALAAGGLAVAGPEAFVSGSADAGRAVSALALAAVLTLVTAVRHRGPLDVRQGLVIGAIVAAIAAESIAVVTLLTPAVGTVDHTAQLGLSIAWAVTGIALIALGLVARGELASTARRAGIPLLGAAVAKVVVYDTARLAMGQRAVLFLAIGGLLLVGAYLYTRLLTMLRQDGPAEPTPVA